ncbi:PQQ-binding-like beta-propeller repeat protein [Streptomyces ficellus]|uniref:PQQ-binding-like beta-propeller repeat protein n=1 Tax=Streptomyces ficellus TaxID=1977088 RepID=A0ABT7Z1U5_9ACTN|nr:PQQ-binding-like beta-propeller repeat protein [Streptomyces ficellus]MDN3293081.1 PQQ-binding-like beta-propeller repeat protein [Streptomyces ficellus]
MTQPPPPPPNQPPGPPPNQPPGPPTGSPQPGGFGAPQDPPPGFGAPTPPPQDPAYGYPQTPPAQPPGYGYPQAPYQAPGQQPGYGSGYPAAPMHPMGQPAPMPGGPGGVKKLSTPTQIIIAATVAVVLIIAAGVWYAAGSGGSEKTNDAKGSSGAADGGKDGGQQGLGGKEKVPANTKSRVAFQLPQPEVGDLTFVGGSWVTDKAYVKTNVRSVVGHDLAKGTPLWTLQLPGDVCAVSRHMKDNKTAIAFEATKRVPPKNFQPCTEVGAIDLNTGKLLWTRSVSGGNAGDRKVAYNEVTLGASTVAAGGTDGGAAWDLTTGKELWKPQVDADSCYDMGYGGGEGLVAARKCGPYDNQYVLIQNLEPGTGAPISSYKMPTGVEYASVVSTKPLVVAADVGDTAGDGSGISDFFSIDEKTGKLKAKISANAERYAGECGSTEVEACEKLVVGNNRLYLPTEDHEGGGEYGDTNEIVSFDLTTGKPTTDKADAGDRYSMVPLRMDGANLIAYKVPPYDKGGQVVSIDGSTFKQTVLMENPSDEAVRDAEESFSLEYNEMLYAGGRLFLSENMLSERSSSSSDEKKYLAMSFTTN